MPKGRGNSHWFLAFAAIFLIYNVAAAQEVRRTVRIDGDAVLTLTGEDSAGLNERVRKIEGRLALLLSRPDVIAPATITHSGPQGEERVISVSGVRVITVTRADAENNLMSIDALAAQWAEQINTHLQAAQARRSQFGARFVTEVRGKIESAFKRIAEAGLNVVPRALAALVVLCLVWAVAALVRFLMRFIFRLIVEDLTVENLLKQVAYYSVWFLGLIIAADALGFDFQTVVTGLGLTSLALGFALKDILSNFVSGIVILLLRPFRLRDQIVVGETEGTVVKIHLRATQIRTYDGRLVLVPNQELLTSRVTNNTASIVRRGNVKLFLGYDSDVNKASELMLEVLRSTEGVLREPPPRVRISDLGAADLEFEALYWTDSQRSDFVATAAEVRRNLVRALHAASYSLPDPAKRTVVVKPPVEEGS